MENLKLRCPSCQKLYSVEKRLIQSRCPQFECSSCSTYFEFDVPADAKIEFVRTRKVIFKKNEGEQKHCPKCHAINVQSADECISCHVIFAKLEGLPEDSSLNAQPRLVRLWRVLVQDYDNLSKHMQFIDACQEAQALSFAHYKYLEMKKILGPTDSISADMLNRLKAVSEMQMDKKTVDTKIWTERFWTLFPYLLSLVFVMIGFSFLHLRNMIGVGFALALLTIGLKLFFKGRWI